MKANTLSMKVFVLILVMAILLPTNTSIVSAMESDIIGGSEEKIISFESMKVTFPQKANEAVEYDLLGGEHIKMLMPHNEQKNIAGQNNGTLTKYEHEEDGYSIALSQVNVKESKNFGIVNLEMTIYNANAPQEYSFEYVLEKGQKIISGHEYHKKMNQDDIDIGKDCYFIIDEEKEIIFTIVPPRAFDNNGEKIEVQTVIKGSIVQFIFNFNNSTIFPINISAASGGTIYKTETLSFYNTQTNINRLIAERQAINARQNSSNSSLVAFIVSIFGLFNVYTGITGLVISGSISGNSNFLEDCEDTYSYVQERFTQHQQIWGAKIYYKYRGTYHGPSRGYLYRASDITYSLQH